MEEKGYDSPGCPLTKGIEEVLLSEICKLYANIWRTNSGAAAKLRECMFVSNGNINVCNL